MIAFDLKCEQGHVFEGWFKDSASYEDQKNRGLISCPVCNETGVNKIPSVFSIKSSGVPVPASDPAAPAEADDHKALSEKIVHYLNTNFDDVGCEFAREALKIHYGVSEPRNIRGVSTDAEEKTLKDEGVRFFKLPVPPQSDTES